MMMKSPPKSDLNLKDFFHGNSKRDQEIERKTLFFSMQSEYGVLEIEILMVEPEKVESLMS